MSNEAFGDAAEITPKRTKTPYVFVIVHDSTEGIKVEEFPSRPDATKFVNTIGAEKVIRAYKVSEVIQLKTSVRL